MRTPPLQGSPTGLYPHLLGASWRDLGEAVRRLHGEDAVQAAGTFRVRHGSNFLARLLARLARLPAAAEAVETRLVVSPFGKGEKWSRTFAGLPLISYQWARPDGLLVEQAGPLEIRFRLEVRDGALFYHAAGAALRLGPLRAPLPRGCAPRITAWEKPLADGERTEVSVEFRLPLLGLLVGYEGTVTRVEVRQ